MYIPEHVRRQDKVDCIDMHTCGEPTRIVISSVCQKVRGTLLEQRAHMKEFHDQVRKRLILEPRGHWDMYGAVLLPRTELVDSGKAHIGVLFLTNEGYSPMCGPTIALGRLLVDNKNSSSFPRLGDINVDTATQTALVNLHAPCGLIEITVPTNGDGSASDPSRPVSFVSTPSFATGISVSVAIPQQFRWPQLGSRESVEVDFAYGGAHYCLVSLSALGFTGNLGPRTASERPSAGGDDRAFESDRLASFTQAATSLKAAVDADHALTRRLFLHPAQHSDDLAFLYSVIIVDDGSSFEDAHLQQPASLAADTKGAETGLCIFADGQLDRSPTGSAVAARVALAHAKGTLQTGVRWTYHSLVSRAFGVDSAFVGSVHETLEGGAAVRVEVEGKAFYTGHSTFVVEGEHDAIGDTGFAFHKLL